MDCAKSKRNHFSGQVEVNTSSTITSIFAKLPSSLLYLFCCAWRLKPRKEIVLLKMKPLKRLNIKFYFSFSSDSIIYVDLPTLDCGLIWSQQLLLLFPLLFPQVSFE